MKGKNCPTTFLPLNAKICGQARYINDREAICLIKDQANHISKRQETEKIVNIGIIKQEIEIDNIDKMEKTNGKINPYHKIVINKVERNDMIISQIEQ